MDIQDVINIISRKFSYASKSISCVNLLGQGKKYKEERIKDLYNQFIKYGNESVVCASLNSSSDLYHWSITLANM